MKAAVIALTWFAVEVRSREPLVDMRMMRLRGVWTTNLTAILLGAGMFGSFILIPQLIELPKSTGYGFGGSVTQGGLYLLPATMMMVVFTVYTVVMRYVFQNPPFWGDTLSVFCNMKMASRATPVNDAMAPPPSRRPSPEAVSPVSL